MAYYKFSDGSPKCYICNCTLNHGFFTARTRLAGYPLILCDEHHGQYARSDTQFYKPAADSPDLFIKQTS